MWRVLGSYNRLLHGCRRLHLRPQRVNRYARVWVYRGILPWQRGVVGIKWRDIEVAAFTQNFTSWSTHSYSLHVLDRYTRKPELVLTNMFEGDKAVMYINTRLNAMIRSQQLVG